MLISFICLSVCIVAELCWTGCLSLSVCVFFVCTVPNIFAVADTDLGGLVLDAFVCTLLYAVFVLTFPCILGVVFPPSIVPVVVLGLGPTVDGVLFAVVMYGTFFPGTEDFVVIGPVFVCGADSKDFVVGIDLVFDCGVRWPLFVVMFAVLYLVICGNALFVVIGVPFVEGPDVVSFI